MNTGRKNSKSNIGIHGHAGDTSPGQTRETPKNLSESEDRGREESVGFRNAKEKVRSVGVRRVWDSETLKSSFIMNR